MDDYGTGAAVAKAGTTMDVAMSAREQQRIQAQAVMAKKFPRNLDVVELKVRAACKRVALAEQAEYTFPRGNQSVTGPSIRLAEVLKQCYGNMESGIREIEQKKGSSTMEAYCWDIENNTYSSRQFEVAHWRDTKTGGYALTDARDIYEITANQGARRERACILECIPGDLVDMAVDECRKSLKAAMEGDKDGVSKRARGLLDSYAKIGVTQAMLEKKTGKPMAQWGPDDIVSLTRIGQSIKDGITQVKDEFEGGADSQLISAAQIQEINKLVGKNTQAGLKAMQDAGYKKIQSITVADFEKVKEAITKAAEA